jgi:hypothetical protein
MQLPAELTWLEWVVGTDWPEGDEDALWRMRDAWLAAAEDVRAVIEDGDTAYYQVISAMVGSAADQFTAYWQKYADGDDAYLAKLAHVCDALARHCDQTGTQIEYAKYQFIIFLIILACQIAYMLAMAAPTFGASTAGIPVAEVATQSLIRIVAQNVLRSIITFVVQNVVSDVVIQMVQLGEGHRAHFDASRTVHAAVDGIVSGAIFGAVGTGVHLAGARFAPKLGESMLGRIGEGAVTNTLGALATNLATGQPITLASLAKQATAGAVGSAAHHDSAHDDLLDTDEPDLPHRPGDRADDPAHSLPQHVDALPDLTVRDEPGTHDPATYDRPGTDPTGRSGDPGHPVDVTADRGREPGPQRGGDHIYDVLAGGQGADTEHQQPHGTGLAGTPVDPRTPGDAPTVAVPPETATIRAPVAATPVTHDGPVVVTDQGAARPAATTPPGASPTALTQPGTAHPTDTSTRSVTDARPVRPDGGVGVAVPVGTHLPGLDAHLGDFRDRAAHPGDIGWRGEAGRTLTVEQNAVADTFLHRAYANESVLTPQLREIAHRVDGQLFGEEFARKGADSFKRKLADEIAADPLLPMSAHLANMKDAVRYTVGLPGHGYAEGARRVVDAMLDHGYQPVKFTNMWGEPEGYRGINSFWHDPRTGQVFEVQFHTEASFQAKTETHGLYEIERTTHDPVERERATTEMNHRFAQVPVPDGAADIGLGDHPTHAVSTDVYDRADDLSAGGFHHVTDAEAVELVRDSLHRTPAGYAFYPPGDEMLRFADAVRPRDGVVNLDLHGSTDGFHLGDRVLTGEQFAHAVEALRREGALTIGPDDVVRLGACDVARGEDSPAARFADESGHRVIAPTERLWTNLHGDEVVSSAHLRDGRWVPGQPPDGHWRTFPPVLAVPEHPEPVGSTDGFRARGPDEDLARLYEAPDVQRMLHDCPPELADSIRHGLADRPELVSVLHDSPELRHSLLSRPVTLDHVLQHEAAVHVLREVVDEVRTRGTEAMLADGVPTPRPTDLTPAEIASSDATARATTGDPFQPGFDVRRRGDTEYLTRYLTDLYAAARPAQHELNALADRIAADTDGEARYREHPKDRTRAMDKARKYAFQLDQLNDLAAACVILERPADIYRALDVVRATPGIAIASYEDRLRTPQPSGYRDIQMTVQMSNGHVAEFRLHLRAIEGVSDWEHALYEVRRDLDAVARDERRDLSDREQALVNAVLRREQDAFWSALRTEPPAPGGTE